MTAAQTLELARRVEWVTRQITRQLHRTANDIEAALASK